MKIGKNEELKLKYLNCDPTYYPKCKQQTPVFLSLWSVIVNVILYYNSVVKCNELFIRYS